LLRFDCQPGFWPGLLFRYTRSKLIDRRRPFLMHPSLTGPIANFPVADSFNRRLEQDVSNGDIPNYFVPSWVYELPIGAPAASFGRARKIHQWMAD